MSRDIHSAGVKPLFFASACALIAASLHAETVVVFAGGGTAEKNAPAIGCRLLMPFGLEFAPDGAAVIVEMTRGNRVLRVDAAGRLTHLAGNGAKGFSGDGAPASGATFNGLHNLAIAPNGDIYLADTWNYCVRRIDGKTNLVETFAGSGKKSFAGDGGAAKQAGFGSVINVAFDRDAAHLYVADIDNRRVRRIRLRDQIVETVAGNGTKGIPADGSIARDAPLVDPRAVAPTADGGFYVLERGGHALRHVDAAGRIRTVAGTGQAGLAGDGGNARDAQLRGPKHLCIDRDESVIIADTDNHVIRRFTPGNGMIARIMGSGKKGSGGISGAPLMVELNEPHGVTVHDGRLYVVDSGNDRVLVMRP